MVDEGDGRSVRAGLSVLAGAMLYLTFEPIGWWWLAPAALAVQFVVLFGQGLGAALTYGVIFGWRIMVPLLWWTGEYVGPVGLERCFVRFPLARASRSPIGSGHGPSG